MNNLLLQRLSGESWGTLWQWVGRLVSPNQQNVYSITLNLYLLALHTARLSVRLSVHAVPPIYWKSESRWNFKFGGEMTRDTSNWESKFED